MSTARHANSAGRVVLAKALGRRMSGKERILVELAVFSVREVAG